MATATDRHEEVSQERLLTPAEVARWLGVTEKCLSNWRVRGGDAPQVCRIGYNRVRYRKEDVTDWIKAHLRTSTSDPGGGNEA